MKTALITGATSGIGRAVAQELIKDHRLILCGRRSQVLESLKEELKNTNEVCTLVFDVRDQQAVKGAIASLPEPWKNMDILINNAGNAHGLAPFDTADSADLDAMVDINVKGLIYVSKEVIPHIKKSTAGHIVNISSIAGKETYGNGTVYCASKAAVESISKGMRIDLAPHNIKVTNIAPGAVETDFSLVRFKGDAEKADKVYKGYKALQAEDVATTIAFCIRQAPHVQIADLTILPTAQHSATGIRRKL